MTGASLFTPDFKALPYWWDRTPRPDLGQPALPSRADVVVVGSGYTGLGAALHTARAGRSTVVIDAEAAGWGCSSRNGGQVSSSLKPSFSELVAKHGEMRARGIIAEGYRSLAWLGEFVAAEKIGCDFRITGHFHAAHSAKQYAKLVREISNPLAGIDHEARLVPRSEQSNELGTDVYHGGVVYPRHASVDAALLHRGLLDRVTEAGATIVPHCTVTEIERQSSGFRVISSHGEIFARDVIVGTNGYSGRVTPWLRRRIIPIGSYIIATEPLQRETIDRLFPTDRSVGDTRKVLYYYGASPDRTRILFGGRVSWNETDPLKSAPLLHAELVRIFPELANVRLSHSWMGFVGFTFDKLMHTGTHDGIHYAAGYCGSGIGMATYLGMKLGLKVLGKPEGETAFDNLPFPTRPYYTGYPWFLGAAISYYRWRDRFS